MALEWLLCCFRWAGDGLVRFRFGLPYDGVSRLPGGVKCLVCVQFFTALAAAAVANGMENVPLPEVNRLPDRSVVSQAKAADRVR